MVSDKRLLSGQNRDSHLLRSRSVAGCHGLCDHRNRGPNTVDRSQSLDGCSPDSEGIKPTPHCADAGGDSAYGTYLHSLACSGYRTLSGRRTDCLNSAHSGDYRWKRPHSPKQGAWATEGAGDIFHSSMIELGLLGLLVLVLVISITLMRRYAPASKEVAEL